MEFAEWLGLLNDLISIKTITCIASNSRMTDENELEVIWKEEPNKLNSVAFGPRANYADRATAASWRSSANFCG
jgi:hypothetical protein